MCEQSRACCPEPQIVTEKICGNFEIPSTLNPADLVLWTSTPGSDFVSGTFEVYNSTSSPINANVSVTANPPVALTVVPPGNTISVTAIRPTNFGVSGQLGVAGLTGTYCITLYKRIRK
ncbi:S-Ena type endospore appendage [Bacillus cereus]|uniref:S-Ena type endospore appendage n=1 Tax=Bacillus cereus TaxID=1396 RepID=UPI000BF6A6A8|nr:S-Ena type endospore appendage [Bacillus cereus]PEQ68077.1 hypothetical protein CN469_04340 [Bacillus cereus]